MKWRMVPGILFAFAALMLALDTCCLYGRITAPDGTFLTGTAGGIGLYLFGGLLEVQEHLPYQYAPLYFSDCAPSRQQRLLLRFSAFGGRGRRCRCAERSPGHPAVHAHHQTAKECFP